MFSRPCLETDSEAELFKSSRVALTHSHAGLGTAVLTDNTGREEVSVSHEPALASLHVTVTHLGPCDSRWLGALTPCGDDSSWSKDIVHSEVVVLEECFRYVDNLVEQKQVRELVGIQPQPCLPHHLMEGRCPPNLSCSRPSCCATKRIWPGRATPNMVQSEGRDPAAPPQPWCSMPSGGSAWPVPRKHLAVMDDGDHWRPLADCSHRHHHGVFKVGIAFSLPNSPA